MTTHTDPDLLTRARLLCEEIDEAPHVRGSINGMAAQLGYSIRAALAAHAALPSPAAVSGDTGRDAAPAAGQWVRLMDSDWVNIVNAPSVRALHHDAEFAVNEAVRLTEARLKELNAAAPGAVQAIDERAAFVAWWRGLAPAPYYPGIEERIALNAWQARAALSAGNAPAQEKP